MKSSMINLFKKKKKENDEVTPKAEPEETMSFMLDDTAELNEVEAEKTIVIPDSTVQDLEEEKTMNLETTMQIEDVADEDDLLHDEQDLDDDDEYEYVTPHYGRNAVVVVLSSMLVGIIITYFILKGSMSVKVREELVAQGYMLTNGCNAVASDIREGKTAYIRGVLVTGTYVEVDTTQATATSADILSGYTAYSKGTKITGTIPTYTGSNIITPSASDFKIDKGYYIPQDLTIIGSGELTSSNIRKGVKIFGVTGTYVGD